MKIAVKYGLLVTSVVIAWVVIVRFLIGVGPDSRVNMLAPVLFNVAQIIAIFLGTIRRKRELAEQLPFKEGVKTGLGISFVYALTSCLFFAVAYLIVGPKLLMAEPGAADRPLWQLVLMAYAGLFFFSIIFGLIYATLISFFLARRRSADVS
jgi:hypothetical protein